MALLSQGTTSRHKHIFKGDCCQPPLNRTRNSEHFVQSSLKQSLLPVSKSERSSSSVRWTSSFKWTLSHSFSSISAEKKTLRTFPLYHITEIQQYLQLTSSSHRKMKTSQKCAVFQHRHLLFPLDMSNTHPTNTNNAQHCIFLLIYLRLCLCLSVCAHPPRTSNVAT